MKRESRKAQVAAQLKAILQDHTEGAVQSRPRRRRSAPGRLRIEVENVSRDRVIITIDRERGD